ncbi:N-terminal domain of NEFA-interacting nuclear protein NIP30-domain-containing protein [Thelonectria olida]|uniref:N-terminal domain of NEFA-interacting nuclear protein NIP30-domain-containing protein n=1 Tax=Thelonectria olida TaxID=1576542 RepID=A0A9P8WH05_9HYPO|nr:N-terminal domain of NEFA-interacting nuclear protein NIP30-domain-containing protein [Thelonectria olida]
MSGRFVSAGTIGSSGEVSKDAAPGGNDGSSGSSSTAAKPLHDGSRSKEWEAVQQELEAERRRREEQRVKAATGESEKSLYDILQANKAAKQAAFEEQSKVRNQFRALDDDEIEFLDDVRAKKRAEEDAARREVEQGLKAFREQQKKDAGDAAAPAGDADEGGSEHWEVGRKRKRVKDREVKGVVRRRTSGGGGESEADGKEEEGKKVEETVMKEPTETKNERPPEKKSLGLVGYGSDSDSD